MLFLELHGDELRTLPGLQHEDTLADRPDGADGDAGRLTQLEKGAHLDRFAPAGRASREARMPPGPGTPTRAGAAKEFDARTHGGPSP